MSLRKITLSSAMMSSVGMLRLMAQFFIVPILSRLLSPEDYGLVAMAMPFILFTMLFTDAGLGQSLVLNARRDEKLWSSCFWLTVLVGVVLGLIIAGFAPLVSLYFGEPKLMYIILALAPVVFLQATATIPEVSARKDQRFDIISGIEIFSVAVSLALSVFVAMRGGGAWALVAQQLGLYGSRFTLFMIISSFKPRFTFSFHGLKEHLVFGRDVLADKFVAFANQWTATMIIGKVLGTAILGYYTMAFLFVRLPIRIITGPVQYVLFAHLAPHKDNLVLLRQMVLFFTRIIAIIIFPLMGMIAVASAPFFAILLSDKWALSGTLFMIAAPAITFQSVIGLRGTAMLVLGRVDINLRFSSFYFLLSLIAYMSTVWFGILWTVAGFTMATFTFLPFSLHIMLKHLECSVLAYFKVIAVPSLVTITCICLYLSVREMVDLNDWGLIAVAFGLGIMAVGANVLSQFGQLKSEVTLINAHWTPKPE